MQCSYYLIYMKHRESVDVPQGFLVYCLQYRRSLADEESAAGKGVNTDTPGLGYRIRYELCFFMERTASQNSGRVTRESGLPAASI